MSTTIVQDIWNALGGLLAVIVAIEVLPNLWKGLSRRVRFGDKGKADYRALADAYDGADWVRQYYVDIWTLRIDWAPHTGGRMRPFSAPGLNVGTDGLRRTWAPEGLGEGRGSESAMRVHAFGGSTMMGMGVRDEATVASLLARMLHDAGHAADVVNFGQPAYTAIQSSIAFAEELARDNVPHVALFLDGLNEAITAERSGIAGTVVNADHRADEFNLLQPWRRGALIRRALEAALPRTMRRVATLEDLFTSGGANAEPPALTEDRIGPLAREVAERYVHTIRQTCAMAEDYGVKALFFWQPMLFTKKTLSPHEARYQNDGAPAPEQRAPFFRAVYEAVRADADFRALDGAVDISGLFDASDEAQFIDPFHLAEKGNAAVVEAMLPHVLGALGKG